MAAKAERQVIEADLTWTSAGRFERGVRIAVDGRGMIDEVGPLPAQQTLRLADRAILPGMINAHSHAFQRGLRGRGEMFPPDEGAGNFWTWRQEMYRLVESIDEPTMHRLSVQAFREMLAAGVTTVGEFHYLHHDPSWRGFSMDEVVIRAAAEAGIRLALINTYYKTGGVNRSLAGGQLHFLTESPHAYWKQMDRLASAIDPATQSLGAAAHSIRAASIDDIASLHQESMRRGMVFHMHVEEQPQEVADCVHAYGKTPMALINERLDVNPMFTAVHCTHTSGADMEEYLGAGGNVCINPLTEGNLGDGIPNLARILRNGGRVALGSDSNLRICWTEEMRWLEYAQRLSTQKRGVCVDETGSVGRKLFEAATINGARSLGVKTGRIQEGFAADFFTIDLTAASLAGWTNETLLDSFVFGSGNEAVAETCAAGRWINSDQKAS
ncbi:MAG: formimidoylglutamate deiminase [Phycisphaerales bacterium]|nr:formimidoylglutamate deiminase [Phycisphaerales bacterium]